MKNIKNFLLVLTLVAVVLSFCGCGGNDNEETTQEVTTEATTEQRTTERTTTENMTTEDNNEGNIDDTTDTDGNNARSGNNGNNGNNGMVGDIEEGVTRAKNFVNDVVDDAQGMLE